MRWSRILTTVSEAFPLCRRTGAALGGDTIPIWKRNARLAPSSRLLLSLRARRGLGSGDLRRRPHGSAGYTLIELLMVIAVMGVLLAMAAPRIHSVLQHAKVNAAASVLAMDLQYAQMVAARQRRPVVLILVPDTRQYLIRDRPVGGTVFRTRLFGQDTDYLLDELLSTTSAMEVFPTGITHASTTFTLGLGGYRRHVTFTRAGQIRVLAGS